MDPPDTGRHAAWLAVFWFLEWYQAEHGEPFRFKAQHELASAVGVAPSVITRLRRGHERGDAPWLILTDKTAGVDRETSRST